MLLLFSFSLFFHHILFHREIQGCPLLRHFLQLFLLPNYSFLNKATWSSASLSLFKSLLKLSHPQVPTYHTLYNSIHDT